MDFNRLNLTRKSAGLILLSVTLTAIFLNFNIAEVTSQIENRGPEQLKSAETFEASASSSSGLQEDLIGYYRLEDSTISPGYSLNFQGSDITVNAPSNLPTGDQSFTTALWIKDLGNNDDGGIVGWGQSSGDSANGIELRDDGFQHYFYGNDLDCYNIGLQDGEWHHIAVTFDPSSDNRSIYMDGQLECSNNPGTVSVVDTNVQIGNAPSSNQIKNAVLEDVRIYSEALSQSQLQKLIDEEMVTEKNLVLHQDFNEGPENCDLTTSNNCLKGESDSQARGTPSGFSDNNVNTGDGWRKETPLNRPRVKDYSGKSNNALISGGAHGQIDRGTADGLKGRENLLENPGFEDDSLGAGENVNVTGWDMDHQDTYTADGDSIFDLQASKATSGSYGYGEESCCDPDDDGNSSEPRTGSGYIGQTVDIDGQKQIQASIKANVFVRDLSNVTTCPDGEVYVGEDDSRLQFLAYNSSGSQIGSKYGHWGAREVYNAGNTSGDYHGWTEISNNWATPSGTDEVEMRVYYADATDRCWSWTRTSGGNGAVFWDEADLTANKSMRWVDGKRGDYALQFDKEDDRVYGIDNQDFVDVYNDDREFTINIWMRIDEIYTDTRWNDLVQFADTYKNGSTGGNGFRLERNSDANDTLAFYTYNSDGNNQWNLGQVGPYEKGKWHMFTLVMDYQDENNSRVYLDGELADTTGNPGGTWNLTSNTMEISSYGDWADFTIDNFKIYDRDLTQSELKELYNGEKVRKGLVNEFRFEAGDRNTVYETGNLAHPGILKGSSMNFDGQNDYATIPDIGDEINSSNNFTISYWINYNNFNNYQVAYGAKNYLDGEKAKFWTEPYRNGNEGVSLNIEDSSGASYQLDSERVLSREKKWYQVTYTWNGEKLKAYVGENLVDTEDLGPTQIDIPRRHFIGSYDGSGNIVNARIDELRVYNRSLSQSEVTKLALK